MPVLLELARGAHHEKGAADISVGTEDVPATPHRGRRSIVNRDCRRILGKTLTLATWWIFLGLVFYGFMLYTRNEWVMW